MELLRDGKSDECGCPEQEWDMLGVHVTIHLEPDGSGHAFFDTGDWDREVLFPDGVETLEDVRRMASEWVAALPFE